MKESRKGMTRRKVKEKRGGGCIRTTFHEELRYKAGRRGVKSATGGRGRTKEGKDEKGERKMKKRS